jgi:hypothetical protein
MARLRAVGTRVGIACPAAAGGRPMEWVVLVLGCGAGMLVCMVLMGRMMRGSHRASPNERPSEHDLVDREPTKG